MFVCLFISLSRYISFPLSISLYLLPSLSLSTYTYVSISMSLYLYISRPRSHYISSHISRSTSPSISLSLSLSLLMYIYIYIYIYICLYLSLHPSSVSPSIRRACDPAGKRVYVQNGLVGPHANLRHATRLEYCCCIACDQQCSVPTRT